MTTIGLIILVLYACIAASIFIIGLGYLSEIEESKRTLLIVIRMGLNSFLWPVAIVLKIFTTLYDLGKEEGGKR